MNKTSILVTLGLLLFSLGATAAHEGRLKMYRAQHAVAAATVISNTGSVNAVTPVYSNGNRQPNVITDPISCVRRFGDYCKVTQSEPVTLDLVDTKLSEYDLRVPKTQ